MNINIFSRLNGNESLGPIHVDVCDSKSASSGDDDDLESSHSEEQEPKKVPISRWACQQIFKKNQKI